MVRLATIFAVLATTAAGGFAQTGLNRVTAVRHWTLSQSTRISIEVTGSFEFHSERLPDPERIFFDIVGASPSIRGQRVTAFEVRNRLLHRIRVAETRPGVTRVVLDLASAVEFTASQLVNPHRLVIELRRVEAVAPASSAVNPPPPVSLPAAPAIQPAPQQTAPAQVREQSPAPQPPDPVRAPLVASPPPTTQPTAAQSAPATAAGTTSSVPVLEPAATTQARAEALRGTASINRAEAARPPDPPKPANRTLHGNQSLVRALGLKINRIVLDPGHGGHDLGTSGPKGLLEKDLVLDLAQRLGKLIQERMGAEVVFTRTDDTFVPLEVRTALANEQKADLFLSLHANSSRFPLIAGAETYFLNFTYSRESLDVAARENASSQKSVYELRDLVTQIAKFDKAEESKEFAERIQSAIHALSARSMPGTRNRGVKHAPFVVLIGAQMPSVLAEVGFLSNPREEALLRRPDYRQKLAEALYQGIHRYASSLSRFQVAQADGE